MLRVITITLALATSFLQGRVIEPLNPANPEILLIGGKSREYYKLSRSQNTYVIQGPSIVSIYSRKAVPFKNFGIQNFSINVKTDNSFEKIEFNKNINNGIFSKEHPRHRYTSFGKYVLEFPKGDHHLTITPESRWDSPILVRMVAKKSIKKKKSNNAK